MDKPRKKFTLKAKVAEVAEVAEVADVPVVPVVQEVPKQPVKERKVFKLKEKGEKGDKGGNPVKEEKKKFSLRKKKPQHLMTDSEELEELVRQWYLDHGVGKIPEEDMEALKEIEKQSASANPVHAPADASLWNEIERDYPNYWHHDFVPPTDDPRFAELEAIQKGMPPPPKLTAIQQEALEDAVPPPQGTREFWAWIRRRKDRINRERAEKGLPPLPTKKEKEAAAEKKAAEKAAAKAAKEEAKKTVAAKAVRKN
jgi:hypothetical protein